MDLVTIQTIRIFPDYRVAWMWYLSLQLAVQYLLYHQNLCQMMMKSPISQRRFCFRNATIVRFPWSMYFSIDSTEVVFINLYWKDGRSGKTAAFCKHKSSSLHNQAINVIYSLPRSSRDAWCRQTTIQWLIAQASEKVSNRKYLLKVA